MTGQDLIKAVQYLIYKPEIHSSFVSSDHERVEKIKQNLEIVHEVASLVDKIPAIEERLAKLESEVRHLEGYHTKYC